jgi:hypothetical protein
MPLNTPVKAPGARVVNYARSPFKIVQRSIPYAAEFETLPCARAVSYAGCLLLTYKVFYQEKWTCLILDIQKSLESYYGTLWKC